MQIDALTDFLAVAATGTISAAARQRGQAKQTISRRLLDLERQLGTRLFDRSSRAMRLTAEGELLHHRAQAIVADLAEIEMLLTRRRDEPEGLLRISAPTLLGQALLGQVAAALLARHPELRLDIVLGDSRVDLVEEGFDAAIRVGRFDDSSLVSRLIGRPRTLLVAAPSLVDRFGLPATPADLAAWPAIGFGSGRFGTRWSLTKGSETAQIELDGRMTANSLLLCRDAALAGAGVAATPAFAAREAIAAGQLVHILPDWALPESELRIIFPSRRLMSARLRAFIEETSAQLRAAQI